MPLWVAHLAGMLEGAGLEAGLIVYLSPLAQNFDLAVACRARSAAPAA